MSYSKRSKAHKKPYSQRINKRRRRRVSNLRCPWGMWGRHESSQLFLDNINEAIRDRKAHRITEAKGPWKLVPKDSCEVYKLRRKRKWNRQRSEQFEEEEDSRSRDSRSTSGSSGDNKYKGKDKKNQPRKKQNKKKILPKKGLPKPQRKDQTKGQQRKVQKKPNKQKRRPRRCMHAYASSSFESYTTGSDMDYYD